MTSSPAARTSATSSAARSIVGGAAALVLEIVNDPPRATPGAGASGAGTSGAGRTAGADALGGPGGHGLVGMRERVGMFHGRFSAAPRPDGGFEVRAEFPLEAKR